MKEPAPSPRLLRARIWPDWTIRNLGLLIVARVPMSSRRAIAGVVMPT